MADDREYPIEWDPTEYRYIQIADHIEQQIRTGALVAGAALPSNPDLAEEYGVARMTIRRAIEILVERDLVAVLRGRGTIVRRQASEE